MFHWHVVFENSLCTSRILTDFTLEYFLTCRSNSVCFFFLFNNFQLCFELLCVMFVTKASKVLTLLVIMYMSLFFLECNGHAINNFFIINKTSPVNVQTVSHGCCNGPWPLTLGYNRWFQPAFKKFQMLQCCALCNIM